MSKNIFENVTEIFHGWDGVYVHYADRNAFWKAAGKIAFESGYMNCAETAAVEVQNIFLKKEKQTRPMKQRLTFYIMSLV